jgi:hypothetical protein
MGYALARVFGGMILATPADGVSASDHVLAPCAHGLERLA